MTTLAKYRPATTRRALLLTLAVVLLVSLVSPTATQAVEVDPPVAGDSVLVVAPSPGADVAIAAGITSALPSYASGAGVTIAYVTNGDFVSEAVGTTRQGEAVDAQEDHLGRSEADLIFFGYPDGYLAQVWATDAPAVYTRPVTLRTETYASRGLGSTDWFDYRSGPGEQHAPYNSDAMLADMVALITERRPDHIFTASEHNNNDDYATTSALVTDAVAAVVAADDTYGTVVHGAIVWHPDMGLHSTWPQDIDPDADIIPDTGLSPTTSLEDVGLLWAEREQFVVPTAMQDPDVTPPSVNDKVMAVNEHASIGGLSDLLSRFIHRDEIFWTESFNAPAISIADATVTEGETAEFTISRTGATNFPVSVTATASDGTAVDPDDYTDPGATVVTIPAGATSATFDVVTVDNDVDDGDKTFTVTLTVPSSPATLVDATAVGTITDDDTAGVTIDDDGLSVIEGGASDTYTVVLDSEPTANVVITVTPDAQVTAAPSPLTFTPANWETPQTVIVTGIADGVDETDPQTGTITHSATSTDPKYDAIAIDDATAVVVDPTGLVVEIEGLNAGSTGVASVFTASVVAGGNGTVTYAWTVTRGATTVTTGTGATLTFTPTLGGLHTVTVVPSDDDGAHAPVAVSLNVLTDIEDSTFVQDIIWLADQGITKGCNPPTNDRFCPNNNVTRGQMAAFLVRFLGLTDIDPTISFTDTAGNTFEQDILKLATAGITRGCNPPTNDRYCPDSIVTRGQMAAFLVRALGLTDNGGGDLFDDDDTSIFEDDIDKLATAGITRGCNPPANNNFCPDNNVTRGQMAAFIRRADALS